MYRLTPLLAILAFPAAALELEECRISAGPSSQGINARCGTMIRPLNPDEPDGETIELKVAVVPALDLEPQPDPVVPIAGGPGQATIEMYSTNRHAFEQLRRTRDILLVDQRGTGESSRMSCAIDEELIEGAYSPEQVREVTGECLKLLPHDPRFFTTSVAVRDLDAVREALGYPSLNLYGVSYGSRVAQHFARQFPDSTRTVIIDGVVPPQLPLGPDIALQSQRAVDELLARCAVDEACNEAFPNIAERFDLLVADLRENPRELSLVNPVTGRTESVTMSDVEMAAAIRLMVYQPATMALLPLMVDSAAEGNLTPLTSFYQLAAGSLGESLAIGMHNAVMCTEDVPFYNEDDINYEAIDSTYMGPMQIDALKAICELWPAGPLDEDFHEPLDTDIPFLLLSGDADPITPPDYAVMAMEKMKLARHIAEPDQGHGLVAVGCMPRLLAEFVESQDPVGLDAECLDRAYVPPFFVDFSGPTP